jgi:hypothetical protein
MTNDSLLIAFRYNGDVTVVGSPENWTAAPINHDYDNLILALTGSSLFVNRYYIK